MAINYRQWRVTGTFHKVGEVAAIVTSPNWQGALRKGALAIKRDVKLKGRRLSNGVFTVQVMEELPVSISGNQIALPNPAQVSQGTEDGPVPSEVQARKCSNPNCNQPFAHEGMCDNASVEEVGNVATDVAKETLGDS